MEELGELAEKLGELVEELSELAEEPGEFAEGSLSASASNLEESASKSVLMQAAVVANASERSSVAPESRSLPSPYWPDDGGGVVSRIETNMLAEWMVGASASISSCPHMGLSVPMVTNVQASSLKLVDAAAATVAPELLLWLRSRSLPRDWPRPRPPFPSP